LREGRRLQPAALRLVKRYQILDYMAERYLQIFKGEEGADKFLQACEKGIPQSLRSNRLKIQTPKLKSRLEGKGFKLAPSERTVSGLIIRKAPFSPGATTEYLLGYYYLQSIASMLAVEALEPEPGELVCDMCAAPGGKATYISELMNNSGVLYAVDIDRGKMKALRSHVSRMGITNSIMIRTDARQLSELGLKFDRILLDAPCTGEGLLPVDWSRRRSRRLEDLQLCAVRQRELVEAAIQCLRPEGRLTYVTCSIAPEENEEVLQGFINRGELRVEKTLPKVETRGLLSFGDKKFDESLSGAARLYPQVQGTEGFFVCNLHI
jgi:tRNA (cytosine40_48-C5)-methyltransferase